MIIFQLLQVKGVDHYFRKYLAGCIENRKRVLTILAGGAGQGICVKCVKKGGAAVCGPRRVPDYASRFPDRREWQHYLLFLSSELFSGEIP